MMGPKLSHFPCPAGCPGIQGANDHWMRTRIVGEVAEPLPRWRKRFVTTRADGDLAAPTPHQGLGLVNVSY